MSNFFSLVTELESLLGQLNSIIAGGENETVTVNGIQKSSISKTINDSFESLKAMIQGRLPFETKAALTASGAPAGAELAEVWNDTLAENNGLYVWSRGAWVKSKYDSYSALKTLYDAKQTDIAPWAEVSVLFSDVTGEKINTISNSGTVVNSNANWPLTTKLVELQSTGGGEQTQYSLLADGFAVDLMQYSGQYVDVVILAELGSLTYNDIAGDLSTLGLVLKTNANTYPEIKAYFNRKINDHVSEFRATFSVDEMISGFTAVDIISIKVKFKNNISGTIRWGAPRISVGPTKDRAFFDAASSSIVTKIKSDLESLSNELSRINTLEGSVERLQLQAFNTPTVIFSDVTGALLSSATLSGQTNSVISSQPTWPPEVKDVLTVECQNDGSTVNIGVFIEDGNNDQFNMADYTGQYLNVMYLAETNLDISNDFYRTGLLFVADDGYPLLNVTLDRMISENVAQYSGTILIDDLIAGFTNVRLNSFSPQIKPGASGYFKIGAVRISFSPVNNINAFYDAYKNSGADLSALTVASEALNAANSAKERVDQVLLVSNNPHKQALKQALLNAKGMPSIDGSQATITVGTDAHTIDNYTTVDKLSPTLRYLHGRLVSPAGEYFPLNSFVGMRSVTQTDVITEYDTSHNYWGLEFDFYGTELELGINLSTLERKLWLEIDGVLLDENGADLGQGTNSEHLVKITFPTRKKRTLRFISQYVAIKALYHDPLGIIYKSQPKTQLKGVVGGDSFTEGAVATSVVNKYSYKLGQLLGVHNLVSSGLGGTGYLKTIEDYAGNTRLNLLDRIDDLINPFGDNTAPNFVLFCMGINDGSLPIVDVAANAKACFDAFRTAHADVPIFICGPFSTIENNYNTDLANAIKQQAETVTDTFWLDNANWITGTGKEDAFMGDGVSDWVRSMDNTHPTDAGHDYYAQRIYTAMAEHIIRF